ncbi:hypothetical protein GCM10022255_068650 [Dactylosporangium darangshiense]|uniref:Uncharacterized protein n=1 Tax=Dactylosporangium darangshiense TaxID=579108 RepID=A0ABP8DHN8_9ACTN
MTTFVAAHAGSAMIRRVASKQCHPLAHAGQPVAAGSAVRGPRPVVVDLHDHLALCGRHQHAGGSPGGMLAHVRQGLLHQPVRRQPQTVRCGLDVGVDGQLDRPVRRSMRRGEQAQLGQPWSRAQPAVMFRAQCAEHAPQIIQGRPARLLDRGQHRLRGMARSLAQGMPGHARLHGDRGQRVRDNVVELRGDEQAFRVRGTLGGDRRGPFGLLRPQQRPAAVLPPAPHQQPQPPGNQRAEAGEVGRDVVAVRLQHDQPGLGKSEDAEAQCRDPERPPGRNRVQGHVGAERRHVIGRAHNGEREGGRRRHRQHRQRPPAANRQRQARGEQQQDHARRRRPRIGGHRRIVHKGIRHGERRQRDGDRDIYERLAYASAVDLPARAGRRRSRRRRLGLLVRPRAENAEHPPQVVERRAARVLDGRQR